MNEEKEAPKTLQTEKARLRFQELGLKYSNIASREVAQLQETLSSELKIFSNLKMGIKPLRRKDIAYVEDGTIKHLFLRVKSDYFSDREAISFNNGGFIGFAGWADSTNVQPFVTAFAKWCDLIKPVLQPIEAAAAKLEGGAA